MQRVLRAFTSLIPKSSLPFSALCSWGWDPARGIFPLQADTCWFSYKVPRGIGRGEREGEGTSYSCLFTVLVIVVHPMAPCPVLVAAAGFGLHAQNQPHLTSLEVPASSMWALPSSEVCVPAPWGRVLLPASSFG